MYFPYLRGKQYELLALRELVEQEIIDDRIIPIIEPVKATSTLIKTLTELVEKNKKFAVVQNAEVGSYERITTEDVNQLRDSPRYIKAAIIKTKDDFKWLDKSGAETLAFFKNESADIEDVSEADLDSVYNVIPDSSTFRRKLNSKKLVLFADRFIKRDRNSDYVKYPDEFFSNDHVFYAGEGYKGFGDYSIIGEPYSEAGFAPLTVAIHIVYFDDSNNLRVKHFTSTSNDDISNPAGKFGEAVKKFVDWYDSTSENNQSVAGNQLKQYFETGKYPGLGVVKKLSLMHHFEIMNKFLKNED